MFTERKPPYLVSYYYGFSMSQVRPCIRTTFKNISHVLTHDSKTATCLLLISVGQEAHEGEFFESTIDLVNQSFGECIISLYDSLQRYTIALTSNQPPESYLGIAEKEGCLWLERNEALINKLTIPHRILRWNHWLQHPEFLHQKQRLMRALNEDELYYQAFKETAETYLCRYKKRISNIVNFDQRRAESICFDYLVEECVVLCLWPELGCEFEVYPNAHNLAMEATREKFITPYFPNLLHSVSLRFRHAKQLKPQQFVCMN